MDENTPIPIYLTIKEIQVLNNVISNSVPTVPYLAVSQLVQRINEGLEKERQKVQPDEVEKEKGT